MKKYFLSMVLMALFGTAWADDLAIKSAEDWATFCSSPDAYANGSITLDADISVDKAFPAAFTGTFDGQGHAISMDGLAAKSKFALFSSTGEGAVIRNFTVSGKVTSTQPFAAVAVEVNGPTTIENVQVSADINASGYPLSGFVVYNKSQLSMKDCTFSGHIKSTSNASVDISGFISSMSGESSFKFDRCAFTGGIEILAGWRAGAFVSTNTSTMVADCEMNFCEMSGSISQENGSERVGGFIGSPNTDKSSYIMKGCLMNGTCKRWKSNQEHVWITQENCIIMGCGTWKTMGSNTSTTNCYLTPTTELTVNNMSGFNMASSESLSSGALCYSLNGDQSSIGFYQTLNSDAAPTLDSTHKQVFCSGRKHCDGSDYEGVTYNNESGTTTQDSYDFVDGLCSYCGSPEEADGYLLIKSQKGWDYFVKKHNAGTPNINVRLFCDVEQNEGLADGYCGTLDGQGHTITMHIGAETGRHSLLGSIYGATIRNLVLEGEVWGEGNTAPLASITNQPVLVENVISKVTVTQTNTNNGNCAGFIGQANNVLTLRNCISAATVKAGKDAGGFVGWAAAQTIDMENCAMIGDVTINTGNSALFLRIRHTDCKVTMTNCYYVPCTPTILSGNGVEMAVIATEIDRSAVESGALCYLLNGDQTKISLFQTIGKDKMPVPDSTHGQVYANGHKHCDGSDYDGVTYSNTEGTTTIDEHDYVNGVCDYCGKLKMNADGVFEINDERTLGAFAKAVNNGDNTISAILTDDVSANMGGKGSDCPMIGITIPFNGTIDGQGHTLNLGVDANGIDGGMFANVGSATIKNMTVEGTVRNAAQAGFIGNLSGANTLLENIIVNLDIEGNINVGGILGNGNNNAGICRMNNVMFAGKVKYVGPANKNGIGGFCGWAYDTKFELKNCIMAGQIDLGTGTTPGMMLRMRSTCSVKTENCAYVPIEGINYINGSNAEMDNSPVACENASDGSLCYAANGFSFEHPVWYQSIGSDDYPVLNATHNVVYRNTEGFTSHSKDEYAEIANDLIEEGNEYTDPTKQPAQKSLVDDFKQALESLTGANSFDELVAAYYPAIAEKRIAVTNSMKAYAKLTTKVNETRDYIANNADDFKGGPAFQKLESYLSDDMTDPDEEEFPNGSYTYIMDAEHLQLDEAGIEAEIAFISQMLADALNEGLNPGADATSFIVNAYFSDEFNGWEGVKMNGRAVGEKNGMRVAESWTKAAFDMHQTITLPENGIYELSLGGIYHQNGDAKSSNMHAAMLYLNGHKTFLASAMEGFIAADEAVDGENCWITGGAADMPIMKDGELTGYITNSTQGAACAFASGRYTNKLLVNVTDGTLTLGVRNAHAIYNDYEWACIGNLKLTYLGTMEEAAERMDGTITNMCERANSIINSTFNENDCRIYPNYSKALKQKLADMVAKAATLASAQEKYDWVGEMGETFEQIYVCQSNYAILVSSADAMAAACETLQTSETITEKEADDAFTLISKTQGGYLDGTYSNEEAANGGDLKNISFYPTMNEDGFMQIGDAKSLAVFGAMVSAGMTELNAALTNDVTANESFIMIGGDMLGTDRLYNGIFDGQGHTLNVTIELPDHAMTGVFGHTGNATIRNTKFTGTIIGKNNTGLIGRIDGKTNIENVESNLNIEGYQDVGGFAGAAFNGPQRFNNCLFSGKVKASNNGGGGYVGWSSTNRIYADNCLSIGEVEGEQCAYFFRVKCNGTVGTAGDAGCYVEGGNMYYLKTSDPSVLVSGTPLWWGEFLTDVILEVSTEELASGKVCHLLNAGETEAPAWRQTLKTDSIPLLLSDHLKVLYSEEKGYYNELPDGISAVEGGNEKAGSSIFDLTGRKVQRPAKGIYIIGGRKVLVK